MPRTKRCGFWEVYVEGFLIDKMGAVDDETEKAILLTANSDDLGLAHGWFPKSVITMHEDRNPREIHMPQWIFDKKRDM